MYHLYPPNIASLHPQGRLLTCGWQQACLSLRRGSSSFFCSE